MSWVRICALVLVASGMACDCGTTGLTRNGNLVLTINSPMNGDAFTPTDMIDFKATAIDTANIKTVELDVGTTKLTVCPEAGDPTLLTCETMFASTDHQSDLVSGAFVLTAIATDAKGITAKQQVKILIQSLTIAFTSPSPPQATVSGTSPVAVAVMSAAALKSVVITYDMNKPLASWANPPVTMAFSQSVDWASKLGTGMHTLTAIATDVNGQIASATMMVTVDCTTDADCATNTRCCISTGLCNAIVASGATCDCSHPCPLDEGCFPGICGQGPAACRTGCFPGSEPDATHPMGVAADTCPQQELNGQMVPAFCSALSSGATTQNKGGACAPGDACDVVKQDCPNYPLHRELAEGANNPLVPYSCIPVAPGVNGCFPAGKVALNSTGCVNECDNDTTTCDKGYVCAQMQGDPNPADATCTQQCEAANPSCPAGQQCGILESLAGNVPYTSGSCE